MSDQPSHRIILCPGFAIWEAVAAKIHWSTARMIRSVLLFVFSIPAVCRKLILKYTISICGTRCSHLCRFWKYRYGFPRPDIQSVYETGMGWGMACLRSLCFYRRGLTGFTIPPNPIRSWVTCWVRNAEQMINLVHTQNITRNWNAFFQYRLINSPGTYGNQNTNHNNYRFTSWYQSNNKRYQAFLLMLGSKLESAENAGIQEQC